MNALSFRCIGSLLMITVIPCLLFGGGNSEDIRRLASETLLKRCDSLASLYGSKPNILGQVENVDLIIKDQRNITINDRTYCGCIIACREFGELILLDSCNCHDVLNREEINIPGMHANFGDVIDLNNDGYDEITINLSAGAHGYYAYFVSVYEDSLSLVRDDNGNYDFFAMRGGIFVKDIDNDGIQEIIVDHMLESGQKENYTIYKWNGKAYSIHKRIEH